MSKIQQVEIKPWEREKYPDFLTKTELKAMKLMPAPNVKPRATVVRPRKYGGDYLLYDVKKTVPFKLTKKQKEAESRKRKAAAARRKKRALLEQQRNETAATVSAMMLEKKYSIVVIDFETTGLDPTTEEILQVAIIDQDGNTLINELCRPVVAETWWRAEKINGISPADVSKKKSFGQIAKKVAEILLSAETVVAYNERFEYSFLEANGLQPERLNWASDPMEVFAYRYTEDGRWCSLVRAAGALGYDFNAHDALEDVKATLYIYKKLVKAENGEQNL